MTGSQLRVGYDGHEFAKDRRSGKGLQTVNLLGRYIERFIGFAPKSKLKPGISLVRRGPQKYLIWQQVTLPWLIRQSDIDLFLAPYNTAPLWMPRRTKLVLVL